jgi:hypothetical protein
MDNELNSTMDCPFFVLHYKKNRDRREHLMRSFEGSSISPTYVEELDQGEFNLDDVYRFDEAAFTKMVMNIKDNIIGTAWGLDKPPLKNVPWATCIKLAERQHFTMEQTMTLFPFLRPTSLKAPDVSLILKHKNAWKMIAGGNHDYAIIAEDDVVVGEKSLDYLFEILSMLPHDFDYIDIAGGLSLSPRVGNRLVNGYFFEIDPPRPRTTCCAIIRKSLVERILKIDLPIVVGIDWMLIHLFYLTRSKVYWVEPLVFGHGSQIGLYRSNARS